MKQFLKEIFDMAGLPDSQLYFLLGIFGLIIVLGILGII